MFERGSDATTRMLSGSSFSLIAGDSKRSTLFVVLGVVAMMSIVGVSCFFFVKPVSSSDSLLLEQLSSLKVEVQKLQQESNDLRMKLAHEEATRQSLERDFSAQAEELKNANKNLAFYRKNSGASATPGAQ